MSEKDEKALNILKLADEAEKNALECPINDDLALSLTNPLPKKRRNKEESHLARLARSLKVAGRRRSRSCKKRNALKFKESKKQLREEGRAQKKELKLQTKEKKKKYRGDGLQKVHEVTRNIQEIAKTIPKQTGYQEFLEATGLEEDFQVRFRAKGGTFIGRDLARELLKKYTGFKSLEEKVVEQRKKITESEEKGTKDTVFRPEAISQLEYNRLREHCAKNLSDFAAIFLGETHITKPFGLFHVELLKDLYHLSISTKSVNLANILRKDKTTSDNNHYVKYTNDNSASMQDDTAIKDNALSNGVGNVGTHVGENEKEAGLAQTGGGGDADSPAPNSLETHPNFFDQNCLPETPIKPAPIADPPLPVSSLPQVSALTETSPPHPLFPIPPPSPPSPSSTELEIAPTLPELPLDESWKLFDISASKLTNIEKFDRLDRLAIAAPRGHAKSTLVSLAYVLWCIVYKVHRYILLISDTEDQAKMLLNSVRVELEQNERLRSVYGDMVGSGTWGELAIETANEVRIQTRGTGQRMRGMKYRSFRPGLVICDDTSSEQITETEEQRRKYKRWFYSTLLPAVDMDGKVIVIGTILHEDDLLPELLTSWPSRHYSADVNKDPSCKDPLWPEAYRTEDLISIKEQYAARGMSDLFFREYFNLIVSPDEALFKKGNFSYITHKELFERVEKGENLKCFLTVDPALVVGSQRDYTVFCITYVDSSNNLYVADVIRGRWPITGTIGTFFNILEKYSFDGIGMQRIDWDRVFMVPMQTEMRRRQKFVRVTPLQTYSKTNKGLVSKEARIAQLAPRYDVGMIWHVKEAKGIRELEDELMSFPHSKHDDCCDALALSLSLIFPAQKKVAPRSPFRASYRPDSISGY